MKSQLLMALLAAGSALAQDAQWKASVMAFEVGNAMDTVSSYGQPEANPLLASSTGMFSGKAMTIKAISSIGLPIVERKAIQRLPWLRRSVIVMNYGICAWLSGVALRNWRTQ